MRADKALLTFAAAILCLASAGARAQTKSEREQGGYKGPVRSVRIERAKISGEGGRAVEGARAEVGLSTYDERGSATEHSWLKPDGTRETNRWATAYDEKGRETGKSYYSADGALTSRSVLTYDGRGRVAEATFYNWGNADSVNHRRTYLYDDRGNRVQENHRSPDGASRTSIARVYDDRGHLLEVKYVAPSGEVRQRSVYTYDVRGNKTSFTAYDAAGEEGLKFAFAYDAEGHVAEQAVVARDGSPFQRVSYTYKFDDRGNWVERREVTEFFKDGGPRTERAVTYRAITYY